jgi:thioredoxin-like negative regulator of GroEL
MLADMYAGLDQQEKELTDWRKIYPELMRIYFQWWDGKHDDAIASVKKLLDQDSSDDWRTLLAKMLELDQKYNDAIPVLESVSARYGPTYIQTQKQLLHVARLANNNDAGQKAALRLLSLHLPQQELLQIMDDLRNVGLKDKADEIMNKQVQGRMPTAAGMQANNQLMRTLNEASNQKDGPKVLELAQQVLNRDPLAQQMGNDNFLRIRALEALKRTGQLDAYIQDVEKQLAAAPDSAKLNWLAAEAYLQQATGNSDDAASAVASAKAVTYFRKVADLSPKNQNLLVSVAQRLYQAHKPDAAADLYASIFKSDFSTGMNQWNNAMQAFQEANRLPEFVKLVNDWTPPPLTPMGGGPDLYYVIVQIANQLKQNDHKPEAEQIYRKALAMDTFQSKQDTVSSLAQMLMDEGRRDEAAAEVEKWVLNQNVQPAAPPILGFNMPQVNQGNWFQSIGWSSNGVIQAPILHFLELADALGLGPKLRQELKARADKNVAGTTTPPQGTPIDSDRMAALMLAIIARDPSYKADLEKMIKDYPVTATMQMNTNGYLIVSQELEKWPEERPMALRLTKMAYDSMNTMPNNFFFQNIVVQQMLRLAEADGDHKTMQDVLRKEVAGIREQRSINPQQVPLDQDLRVVHTLIQEGMLKEASDLLADAKTDPQLANGNNYFKQRLDDAQNELSFAKGEKSKVGLVYGIVPKKGKKEGDVQFFWDVVPGNSQNNGGYFSRSAWAEGGTTHPTSYRIEISGGADEPHMTHFTSWDNVASRGSVTVSIPPGVQVIQATLIRTKPEPPGPVDPGTTPPPPEPVPSAVATGQVILLGGPDNLLKNPNFQISKDASGKTTTDGWHGLISPGATQEKGGPMPDGTYQTLEAINGNFGQSSEVVSDKIPLQPNTNYVFSGWMRLSGNIAFRYTDASGKVLNPNQIVWGGNDTDWQWRAWVLQGNPHSPVGGETIPPNAAFVEISLRPNQDSDFAGLALREWPAPTTAPAPAPAK